MQDLAEHFWSKVDATAGATACWPWRAGFLVSGYGSYALSRRTTTGPRTRAAHRMAWELARGPIADGLCVCHKCDNRQCCNPDHLFLGTHNDNRQDSVAKGRHARRERSGRSKLAPGAVSAIRCLHALRRHTQRQLGSLFGVDQAMVSRIVRHVAWR